MIIENAIWFINPIDNTTKLGVMCTIDGQEMTVPLDPANRHYQAIQEWVAEGNTIQDAD